MAAGAAGRVCDPAHGQADWQACWLARLRTSERTKVVVGVGERMRGRAYGHTRPTAAQPSPRGGRQSEAAAVEVVAGDRGCGCGRSILSAQGLSLGHMVPA